MSQIGALIGGRAKMTIEDRRRYARERYHWRVANETPAQRAARRIRESENLKRWVAKHPARAAEQRRKNRIKNGAQRKAAWGKYYADHKAERMEKQRLWRLANPSKVAAQRKRRTKDLAKHLEYETRRRARLVAATLEDCTARIKAIRKATVCNWCNGTVAEGKMTVDHLIPLSRGGAHAPYNLVPSCKPCNVSKNNKLPNEWLKEAA